MIMREGSLYYTEGNWQISSILITRRELDVYRDVAHTFSLMCPQLHGANTHDHQNMILS